MKASFVELRRKSSEIIRALDRNERVTLFYRGRPKAILHPISEAARGGIKQHPAFGMWRDREDLKDPATYVRELRKGRFRAL